MGTRLADGSVLALAQVKGYQRTEKGRQQQVRPYVTRRPIAAVLQSQIERQKLEAWRQQLSDEELQRIVPAGIRDIDRPEWIPRPKWLEGQRLWVARGEAAWLQWANAARRHADDQPKADRNHVPWHAAKLPDEQVHPIEEMMRQDAAADEARRVADLGKSDPRGLDLGDLASAPQDHRWVTPRSQVAAPVGPVSPHSPELQSLEREASLGLKGTPDKWQPDQGVQGLVQLIDLTDDGKVIGKSGMDDEEAAREVLSYFVSAAIGAGAEPTIEVGSQHSGEIVHEFAQGDVMAHWMDQFPTMGAAFAAIDKLTASPQGRLIGLLDYLITNSDRHSGNVIISPDGRPIPIDHGLAQFDDGNRPALTGAFWENNAKYWTRQGKKLRGFQAALAKVQPEFTARGRDAWYQDIQLALSDLIGAG